jgi:hypothetical protein
MYTKKKANYQNSMEQSLRKQNKEEVPKIISFSKNTKADISKEVTELEKSSLVETKSVNKSINKSDQEDTKVQSSTQLQELKKAIQQNSETLTQSELPKTVAGEDSPKTKLRKIIEGHRSSKFEHLDIDKLSNYKSKHSKKDMPQLSNRVDNMDSNIKESPSKGEIQFPIKVNKSLLALTQYLTRQEQEEIKKYSTIYYINLDPKAVRRKLRKEEDATYDDDNGDYILIAGEHIAYRYEILDR